MEKFKRITNWSSFIRGHFRKLKAIVKEAERAFYKSDTLLEDICLK
jgi:hypothetical protein